MFLSTLALATLLSLPATNAQTAVCNPLTSEVTCPADKALSSSFTEDFKTPSKWFAAETFPDRIAYGEDGLSVTLTKRYDNPAIKSNFYIMFGKLEVVMKAAPGRGVVSSFYLQSDDLDEIDLEWIGSDNTEVQTNYFSKGNTSTYDRGQFHGVYEPQQTFHNYTIDWTNEALTWYLDGQVLRVLRNDSASGYPQSPMYIMSGVWAGGDPDNAPGTIQWAGGLTDFTQAPFSMCVKKVIVTDYSTGTEYSYTDKTGKWSSIEAKNGAVMGRLERGAKEFSLLAEGLEVESYTDEASSSSAESSTSITESEQSQVNTDSGIASSISRAGIAYSSTYSSISTRSLSPKTSTLESVSSSNTTDEDYPTTMQYSNSSGSISNYSSSYFRNSNKDQDHQSTSNGVSFLKRGVGAIIVSFALSVMVLILI
ncbi:hypothetical protein WICPIJ_009860 [Wickerhamomyces pijperi]|uniref:Crh-like protein n=1 Tax=Wickerhamomyces pijperi TaxID=599730 RepID=A0A9P8PJM2_WICPI|nr:hypothetical protein WICPIJ_009860 [Wickerhamomyces pijperi]